MSTTISFKEWGSPHGIAGQSCYDGINKDEWEKQLSKIPFYKEYLTGPQGGRYEIFKEQHHSVDDINRAKQWLRNNLDVVSIEVINESKKSLKKEQCLI